MGCARYLIDSEQALTGHGFDFLFDLIYFENVIISIIVPIFKESKDVVQKFLGDFELIPSSVLDSIELIVVIPCEDTTDYLYLEVYTCLNVVRSKNRGRAAQLNFGAQCSRGSVLWFLHVDSMVPNNFFDLIGNTMGGCDASAFSLEIFPSSLWFTFVSAATNLRTKLTSCPYGDQGIFVKKSVFINIGGFDDVEFLEDVLFMRKIKASRTPFQVVSEKIRTSNRRWIENGVVYTTLKNRFIMLLFWFKIPPHLLRKFY